MSTSVPCLSTLVPQYIDTAHPKGPQFESETGGMWEGERSFIVATSHLDCFFCVATRSGPQAASAGKKDCQSPCYVPLSQLSYVRRI